MVRHFPAENRQGRIFWSLLIGLAVLWGGLSFMENRNWKDERALTESLCRRTDNPRARYAKAYTASDSQEKERWLREVKSIMEKTPGRAKGMEIKLLAKTYLDLAEIDFSKGAFEQAERLARRSLAVLHHHRHTHKYKVLPLALLAKLAARRGDHQKERGHWKSCLKANPYYPHAYIKLARFELLRGKLKAALAILKQGISTLEGSGFKTLKKDIQFLRAHYLQLLKKAVHQAKRLEEAEKLVPVAKASVRTAQDWLKLGRQVYEKMRLWDKAEASYRKALALAPKSAKATFYLGYLLERRGRRGEAEKLYNQTIKLDPAMADPHHNLGNMALNRGEYIKAREAFIKARTRDPKSTDTLVGLGITTFKLQGLKAALPFFREAQQLTPANLSVYYNLAILYAQSRQPGRAAGAARKVILLDARNLKAYGLYAEQMRLAGRSKEARAFLRGLVRQHPGLPGAARALNILK